MSFYRRKMILATLVFSLCPLLANADELITDTTTTNTTTTAPASTTTTRVPVNVNTTTTKTPADANKQGDSFESICLSSWMKRFADVKDKSSYQNFGQKYCACALTQPLDTDAAVDKAIQICMSRTLLQDSMDSLKAEVGLDKATENDVNQFCLNKWKLIYPQMSEQAKLNTAAFCTCSQPKLTELIKNFKTMVDKDFKVQVDTIAGTCADMVKPSPAPKTQP
ncbi:MAG: hypothetical protein H0T84_02515 [Tatlockia sp.]|nr:hypothetical protein [Tatlockia sp.]